MTQEQQTNSEEITIRTVRLKELQDFASRFADDSTGSQLIPISQARVRSQIRNPCGDGDDVALLTAFLGSLCIGYLGLLPGFCTVNGRVFKVFWGTTLLVLPEMRGRGVGKLLVAAMQGLGVDFIGTSMTESAERLYRRMGMEPLGTLSYRELRADKLKRLLGGGGDTRKGKKDHGPTTIIEKVSLPLYRLLKKMLYSSLLRSFRHEARSFVVREVKRIAELPGHTQTGVAEPSFYRSVEVINWMLSYPWVVSRDEDTKKSDYYFSTSRDVFTYKAFQIENVKDRSIEGFVVVSILTHKGRTVVKVLDHAFRNPDARHMAVVVALRCAGRFLADRIEYDEILSRHLPDRLEKKRLIKKQARLYLFHPRDANSPLLEHRGSFHLRYADGDTGFA
jgi:GNAT superfamily N-acetyltransferase